MKTFEEPQMKPLQFAPRDILAASSDEEETKPVHKPPIIPTTPPDDFD